MTIEKIRQLAKDEGHEARGYGIPFSRNPYIRVINSVSWESWNEGWKEHEQEYPATKTILVFEGEEHELK